MEHVVIQFIGSMCYPSTAVLVSELKLINIVTDSYKIVSMSNLTYKNEKD